MDFRIRLSLMAAARQITSSGGQSTGKARVRASVESGTISPPTGQRSIPSSAVSARSRRPPCAGHTSRRVCCCSPYYGVRSATESAYSARVFAILLAVGRPRSAARPPDP